MYCMSITCIIKCLQLFTNIVVFISVRKNFISNTFRKFLSCYRYILSFSSILFNYNTINVNLKIQCYYMLRKTLQNICARVIIHCSEDNEDEVIWVTSVI